MQEEPELRRYKFESRVLFVVFFVSATMLLLLLFFLIDTRVATLEKLALPLVAIYSILSLTLCTYLMLANKQFSKERQVKKINEREKTEYILKRLNDIFSLRTDLENLFIEYAIDGSMFFDDGRSSTGDSNIGYKDISIKYLDFCVSKLKQIMDFISKDDECAVTIKILIPNPDGLDLTPHITTYARDKESDFSRMDFDKECESFEFTEQTAFKHLLLDEPASEIYFSNDLKRLHKAGMYKNINPDWSSFYNATAVVPIKNPKMRENDEVLGFLCVDNRHGGMTEQTTSEIMKIIANSIYYALRTVAYFEVSKHED